MAANDQVESWSKGRRRAFYSVTALATVIVVVALGPLLVTGVMGWLPASTLDSAFGAGESIHRLHGLALAATSWVILAGVAVQFHRPRRKLAPLLLSIGTVASIALLLPVGGTFDPGPFVVLAFLLAMYALGPAKPVNLGVRPRLLALAAPAVVAAGVYLVANVGLQRSGHPSDPHVLLDHFTAMAYFGASIVIGAVLGSTTIAGWRIAAVTTAAATAFVSAASLMFSEYVSALATPWAVASLIWGLVFGAAALSGWGARTAEAAVSVAVDASTRPV